MIQLERRVLSDAYEAQRAHGIPTVRAAVAAYRLRRSRDLRSDAQGANGVGAWIGTTADAEADVARMAAFYARFTAKRPENAGPVRL